MNANVVVIFLSADILHTMNKSAYRVLVLLLLAALQSCVTSSKQDALPPLQTVDSVDLQRYLGTWYEIASYPQAFQKNCTATRAVYSWRDDGLVRVENSCRKHQLDGRLSEATGRARVVPGGGNAKLEVSFFGPFWGDYWIIELADDYSYAVVGHPQREYLWILSRTPKLDEKVYQTLLDRLVNVHQYQLEPLQKTLQP